MLLLLTIFVLTQLPCNSDTGCDDGDELTEDICLLDGSCEHLSPCFWGSQCDDGNPCTRDVCDNGSCYWWSMSCDQKLSDLTNDGLVNDADLAVLLGKWGSAPWLEPADINGDEQVDSADLAWILGEWGSLPAP